MPSKSSTVVNRASHGDELDRALDHIESRMKTSFNQMPAELRKIVVSPEELKQIVTVAVGDAIARYEVARNRNAELALKSTLRLLPNMARLQDEMGLGEIEFDEARPAVNAAAELSKEAESFVYEDPTDAALSAWDDALKRLSSDNADDQPRED